MSEKSTHWAGDEWYQNTAVPRLNAIVLDVPQQLTTRLIYLLLTLHTTSTGTLLKGSVQTKWRGQVQDELPVWVGESPDIVLMTSKAKPMLFNAGGSPIRDSITLIVDENWPGQTVGSQVVLQPFSIEAEIDQIVLNVEAVTLRTVGVGSWKAFLGCVSKV